MSKGLRVLSCIYPRNKLLECNLRNGSHQSLYFQSLMDKFSLFFRGQNFEKAALNIQIWVGQLDNIMILKFYFLWLVALSPEFNTKILHKKQMERLPEKMSYSILKLYIGAICDLIDNALHLKKHNYHIKSCTFYTPYKVFSRVHLIIENLSIGDWLTKLNYLLCNLIQGKLYINCLLKMPH